MFVRVKKVRGRRYLYLVEGRREGSQVRQKVVCYLGPVSKVAYGVPEDVMTAQAGRRIDWKKVNEAIRLIPLTFEELYQARRYGYPAAVAGRPPRFLTSGNRERVPGEGKALSTLAAAKFRQLFREVGKSRYRMN
jgi:hypothetical protein